MNGPFVDFLNELVNDAFESFNQRMPEQLDFEDGWTSLSESERRGAQMILEKGPVAILAASTYGACAERDARFVMAFIGIDKRGSAQVVRAEGLPWRQILNEETRADYQRAIVRHLFKLGARWVVSVVSGEYLRRAPRVLASLYEPALGRVLSVHYPIVGDKVEVQVGRKATGGWFDLPAAN